MREIRWTKIKIDHSWLKAERSKSVLLPVSQHSCLSGWQGKECTPTHGWANSLLFPIPRFVHFSIVCPTFHYGCAELWCLMAFLKPTVLDHMDTYHTNENVPIVQLRFYKGSVQFTLLHSEMSRHICPRPCCSLVHCICSPTNPVFRHTIPTAAQHSHFSIKAKTAWPDDFLLLSSLLSHSKTME